MIFNSLRLRRLWWLLLWLGCLTGAHAQLVLNADQAERSVLGQVHASPEDRVLDSEHLAFEAWDRGDFVPLIGHLGRGYVSEPVWLALDVQRQDHAVPKLWVLEVGPSGLDRVEVWVRTSEGVRYLGLAGDQHPAREAPVLALKPTFMLDMGADLSATLMVRIQTTSTQVGLVRLISAHAYPSEQAKEGGLLGFIFTVSVVFFVLAVGRAWVARESSSALWAVYILVTATLWALLDGLAYRFIAWENPQNINRLVGMFALLSWCFMAVFVSTMFEFRLIRSWIPKAVGGSLFALLLVGMPGLYVGWVTIDAVVAVGLVLYLPWVVLGLMYPKARGRSLSVWHGPWMGVYIVFLVWHILATQGWLPYNHIHFYGWQVAGVISFIALHWAMIHRAREALRAQDQERLRLLEAVSNHKQDLEDRVAERTRSLATALNEMERAESEQRQLLSMASHEFRTPAAMIKASLESLAMIKSQTPPMVQQRLDNMALASDRMVLLANGLIQQDRLREHRLRPQLQSLDLCALVQSVSAHYPDTTAIVWSCSPGVVRMTADPTLLSMALYNLVDNALRHHPTDALNPVQVSLTTRHGDVGLPGDWAVIRVSDQGPGVPDAAKARLFDRFESDQTRPDRAPSGLGLSIVARVAQVHAGRVAVSDNSPAGSVFELMLPLTNGAT